MRFCGSESNTVKQKEEEGNAATEGRKNIKTHKKKEEKDSIKLYNARGWWGRKGGWGDEIE